MLAERRDLDEDGTRVDMTEMIWREVDESQGEIGELDFIVDKDKPEPSYIKGSWMKRS